ncbi:uncharacterized mitochondrial protein AtMg00820-like [Benincasa hispida]|uniref:uncharacterized mitochondrial protein AtMg00820-like n=1 Tax=Benincasa hispida TaxID=102211 RepID=UPI0019011BAF|nr:uncharacterized mitochondrial protein AtMg00820-like [Benincasa hispida]
MITRAKAGIFKPKSWIISKTTNWSQTETTRITTTLATPQWKKAMDEKYSALIKNKTWTLVPSSPSHIIVGNKWIFRLKRNMDGLIQRYKARLVVKGFHQHHGVDVFETFSPIMKSSTIRVGINVVVSQG